MVNITRGQIQNLPITDKIVEFFEHNSFIDGNVFLGYPILPSSDNKTSIDALLISPRYGRIALLQTMKLNIQSKRKKQSICTFSYRVIPKTQEKLFDD